ncbi:MAG: hypothetical protein WCJ46_05735 [bacterium]
MKKKDFLERRNTSRVIVETMGKCKVLDGKREVSDAISDDNEKMQLVNINSRGMGMLLEKELTPESMIKVELLFTSGRAINAFCEVNWCKEIKKPLYMAGLSFVVVKEDDVAYLNSFASETRIKNINNH